VVYANDILRIEHVTKRFPGVLALNNVSFNVQQGEVHAIVGENGAGKSTLIKLIMGVYSVDNGRILIKNEDGQFEMPHNTIDAKRMGLYANYQHVNFADDLSVGENYFLGRLPKNRLGLVDWHKVYSQSRMILDKFQLFDVDERMQMSKLSPVLREMVTISAILAAEQVKMVIFDEPTAQLEDSKVEQLFNFIRILKTKGISIIYITHRLEEIFSICDRVTVLKDGNYVTTKEVKDVNSDILISLMIGREIGDIYNFQHGTVGNEILRVESLTCRGKYYDISFKVNSGEILGFFGLTGSGRSEVMRAISAVDQYDSGDIYLKGKKLKCRTPMEAMRAGIGLIPEDRQREGLALGLSVKHNINLNSYDLISMYGIVNTSKEKTRANEYIKKMSIKTPSTDQVVKNLSGGNQQKIVISKLLLRDLEVFIFDEPTIGIDVKSKQEIYQIIGRLAKEGKAIIVVSSYLPEVIGISDKIIVMSSGRIVDIITDRKEMTEENILKLSSLNV